MKIQENITHTNSIQNTNSFENTNVAVNSLKTKLFEQLFQQNQHLLTAMGEPSSEQLDRTENEPSLVASTNYPVVPYQSNSKMFVPIPNATRDPSLKRIDEVSSEEQNPTPTIFCSIANVCNLSLDFFCIKP
ncbi:MAG TPA: hypothetical protein VHL30_02770 [Chlamydiales bacterium]|jgi:hypothetical protein|nr:hypothetical protein [Chlamydiales bacterium]